MNKESRLYRRLQDLDDLIYDRYFNDYDENNRDTQFDPFKGTSIEGRD